MDIVTVLLADCIADRLYYSDGFVELVLMFIKPMCAGA